MTIDEIKADAEAFSDKYDGRWRTEEWENDRKERMLKVVLTFKVSKE